jgi:hypothetical protein
VNLNEKSTTENLPEILPGIIAEMERNGITRSSDQSKILRRDHGMKIAPHALAEFRSAQRKKALLETAVEVKEVKAEVEVRAKMEEEVY